MPLWQILLISFGCAFLAALPMYLWIRHAGAKAKVRLREIAGARTAKRQAGVRSFGIRSKGKAQARGNGGLVLFDDELVFVQLVGGNDARIPLASITAIQTPRSFLGKTTGVRLLEVTWTTGDGKTDAIALQVRDLETWIADLGGEKAPAAAG